MKSHNHSEKLSASQAYSPAAALAVTVASGFFYGVVMHSIIAGLVMGIISGLSLDAIARQAG